MVSIKYAVGKGKVVNQGQGIRNHWIDVMEVQSLINDNLYKLHDQSFLVVDGWIGEKTINAIMAFQRKVLGKLNPDGRIDPGGRTLKALNQHAKREIQPGTMCTNIAHANNIFPLFVKPTANYKTGMRRFGARRSKGKRLHAGCDLYAPAGTKIRAMADGTVMRPVEYFYAGTNVLVVDHGDFLARYGEISSAAPGVKSGAKIKKGQHIANVGQLKLKHPMSMLHLELYRGNLSGPLTVAGNKFRRRADLVDPTPVLDASTM